MVIKTIGDRILEEIIRENLVQADSRDVYVWKANAAEVLEAIVMQYVPELYQRGMEILHSRNAEDQP